MNSDGDAVPRYSVYFAPDEHSQMAEFGRQVLQAEPHQHDHPLRIEITRKAAHYGFHSTFKAPMELAEGVDESELLRAVDAFVKTKKPVELLGISPQVLNGFHALMLPSCPRLIGFVRLCQISIARDAIPISCRRGSGTTWNALVIRTYWMIFTFI